MNKSLLLLLAGLLLGPVMLLLQAQNQRHFFDDTWQEKSFTEPGTSTPMELKQASNADATISIDANTIINKVLPTHFGVNTTFRNGNDQLSRTHLYTNAGIGSMRYPAGSGSNIYFYDGIIPNNFRIDFNPIDGTKSANMTPELFVEFKNNANSEATVVVNYFYARYGITSEGTRSARVQQAADYAAGFVRKLNIDLNANIKYWEIGNECYGGWEEGYEIDGVITTGKEYGEDFCVFAEAMKAVDSSIKVGAVVTREDDDWNSTLLPEVQNHADFLVVHNYFTSVKEATAENILESVPQVESVHTTLLNCVEKYTDKSRDYFPVAMTEFNSRGPVNCTMVNGIFVTRVLAEAIKHGYGMVDLWVSEWKWSETAQESKGFLAKDDPAQADYTPRQSYIPYQYFKRSFGDQMVKCSSDNADIQVYASTFSSGETGLIIINSNATAKTVKLDLETLNAEEADIYWHEFYANSIEANDKKFYINGQSGNTIGGGPDDFATIAPYKASYTNKHVIEARKYSVNFLVLKPKAIKPEYNVLMIAVDDLKPLLNCYGETQIHTPNIDRLAEQGVVFTKAYCQWAVCGPSRASIMTGQTPDGTGIRNLSSQLREERPDLITLPEYFSNQGYATAGCGKIYDPRNVDEHHDIYSWSMPYTQPGSYNYPENYPPFVQGTNYRVRANTATEQGPEGVDDDGYTDGQIALDALNKLDVLSQNSQPFFMAVGFKKPHIPFVAPKKYWDLYDRSSIDLAAFQKVATGSPDYAYHTPEPIGYDDIPDTWTYNDPTLGDGLLTPDDQRQLLHGYYACVSYIDAQVGKLLDKLEETNMADNTVILLFGDHGYHLGDHNQWGKHTQFEHSARAPLIISSPKGISGQHHAPVEFVDIYPTLCDLAGLDIPSSKLQGESLAPVLMGESINKDMAVTEYRSGGGSSYSFRTERYRLTLWMQGSNDRTDLSDWDASCIKAIELYDYENDPLETTNLANEAAYAAVVEELKTKAGDWWTLQYNFLSGQSTGALSIPFIEHFENYQLNDAFNGDYWLNSESLWERLWQGEYLNSFEAKVVDDSNNEGSQALELTFTPKASADNGQLIKLQTIDLQSFGGSHFIVSYKARTNAEGQNMVKTGATEQADEWHALNTEYQYFFDTVSLTNNRLALYFNNMSLTPGQSYKVWIDDLKISYTTVTEANDIEEKHSPSVVIYPNPATDRLYFKSSQAISRVTILNTKGQVLLRQWDVQNTVDISNLASGIYFIELSIGQQRSIHKFIKE
ncbi:sulfatase-like hydrolase/transferase [Carboxylicivirga mesophila]|uniref:Sulfatase-like hydrolase/transferase n=1 Tax=Carboxylicivirga mesophila TaxID=1166478 RepID=A0ABS5KE38_9BACT|nr:sulfatase-like hydrolase/transferase [Carboxylicivirga mesophila]MBS2213298.1 sulfatase-like hydrolase/transferase [Carboxylicivirga mesophila]